MAASSRNSRLAKRQAPEQEQACLGFFLTRRATPVNLTSLVVRYTAAPLSARPNPLPDIGASSSRCPALLTPARRSSTPGDKHVFSWIGAQTP